MSSGRRWLPLTFPLLVSLAVWIAAAASGAQAPARAPKIWDDGALADWATPIAALKLRPGHYTAAEYYSVPADNLRTYPVYHPGSEPPGYWDDLKQKKPEALVDVSTIRTARDWIAAGERAFVDLDTFWMRTSDPAVIAQARDPRNFEGVSKRPDGTVGEMRWVVTEQGVQLSRTQCGTCHQFGVDRDGKPGIAGGPPVGGLADDSPRPEPRGLGDAPFLVRALPRLFPGDTVPVATWRMFTVPWAPDQRIEELRTANAQALSPQDLQRLTMLGTGQGVFPRANGSPYFAAKIPDLRLLRYSRYIDATATHRLRGPEDVARYAALVTGADRMDFGSYRILTDEQRRVRFRYADEVLYAIGMYLMSLEPPKNPNPPPRDLVARGQEIFRRENCGSCHPAPTYTSGSLTPVDGFDAPFDHPNGGDIRRRSVGTDPGLALKTRKATGFYKTPSLRGLWYRPRLLHDASITSLEELFDPARLSPDYERKGWSPRGMTKGPIPGFEFLTKLTTEDKTALIAFLRSL